MASARNRANIVILDACRNNPFAAIPELNDNGLAEMKAPTGTFLAYATEPGSVALDGSDGNSPFTRALAGEMVKPGMPLEQMFKQVRVAVLEATGGLQTPWDTSSMTVDFAFKAAGEVDMGEEQLWASVSASRDPVQIMLFMRAYPEGRRIAEAKALLAEVMDAELAGVPEPEPEPVPEGPGQDEEAAFQAAQAEPSVETWEQFIAEHPDSVFRELAEIELAALVEKSGTDPVANPPPDQADFGDIFFDRPIAAGGPEVEGRSLAEIIEGSPLFPPIEGLPDEVWKGKHCSDCHEWTQAAMCDQGKFYGTSGDPLLLGPVHPLGGQLQRVLKAWAEQGCR
jgi:hypothetical protein